MQKGLMCRVQGSRGGWLWRGTFRSGPTVTNGAVPSPKPRRLACSLALPNAAIAMARASDRHTDVHSRRLRVFLGRVRGAM